MHPSKSLEQGSGIPIKNQDGNRRKPAPNQSKESTAARENRAPPRENFLLWITS